MKKYLLILFIITTKICIAQNVGIGTLTPQARLHVTDSSVLFSTIGLPGLVGNTPISGAGVRMMWYADKAAFRTGSVNGANWDKDSIGLFSFASGVDTKAKGYSSTSIGGFTTALGDYSTSIGLGTTAKGNYSTSVGYYNVAKSDYSFVAGKYNDTTNADRLFEIGNGTFSNRQNALTILDNGNTGIGTAIPDFPLSFPTTYGEKISIWGNPTIGRVGFGVQPSNFQMLTDAGTDITFGYGLTASAIENMRIKYNGNVGIGTSAPIARLHVADSNVLFSGPASLPASTMFDPPASGAGVRMFWYPEKGAFRAGVVAGTEWNKSNIGKYSFATGSSNQANGNGSFSTGLTNVSSGENAFTGGYFNTASGYSSLAFGQNNVASNDYTLAMGFINNATASNSVAIGTQNNATAFYSTALGNLNTASAYASTVLGQGNTAAGSYSLSAGRGTIAKAAGSTTLGYFNENTDNPNANVEANTDRIFQIGNGTFSARNNALTILRNGNMGIGTSIPLAKLHVADSSVLFTASLPLPTIANNPPASGNGNRMMWYADKAAFRAGGVDGNEWDKNNVGKYSFATGISTTASGLASSAIGTYNFSTGDYSSTMGINAFAKAKNGVTLGAYNDISDNPNPAVEATTDRVFQIGIGTTSPTRANALTILRNGNMGIGNTDPSFLLDMSKRIRLRSESTTLGAGIWFNNNNNSALNTFVGNDVSNNLQIYSAVGNRTIATFNPSSGGIRVEGPVSANSGNAIASFGGNGEFLVDKPGVVGGRFIIKENGNVGISTNTPQAALDVAGYTVLGEQSAKIKMRRTSFFTNGFDGGISNFPLGFLSEKVLEVSIMIEAASGVFYPLNYTAENGYQVQYKLIGNAIQLRNISGNCGNVLGKPIKINITYEE
jgi:hypothetical protein